MVTRRALRSVRGSAFVLALLSACSQARFDIRPVDTGSMQSGLFEAKNLDQLNYLKAANQ